ncbi:MAG: hypothetical protein KDJ26_03870 [Alphaproteobacteria bacterium]|nr:hypothetical protein [Alphaproteobacteria bacterium]MCB9985039.1 hypothetical protein [Micavibrio sp.]HRK97421.1 hypothetical protein [Alphaproteobacteria bacterium]
MLKNLFNFRTAASTIFISSNAYLFSQNITDMGSLQLYASCLMMTCSASLFLSHQNPKWLFVSGGALIAGQTLIALSAQGIGEMISYLGAIPPILQGSLLLRAAWQSVSDTRFKSNSKITKIFEIIDRYPLASAGLIEAPGTAAIAVGAFMNNDFDLATSATGWTIANLCLAASDPALQAKFMPKLR